MPLPKTDEISPVRKIEQIMVELRKKHWSSDLFDVLDKNQPTVYFEETNFAGRRYLVPLVVLTSNPCRWFVTGGCVMCNYMQRAGDEKENIGSVNLLNQIDWVIRELGELSAFPYMLVSTAGSFLSPFEADDDTRFEILAKLRDAGLERLSFESEAKFCIDRSKLRRICEVFQREISIGIGLESSDDFIRNVCLNKGLSEKTFSSAVDSLKSENISFYNYVLLGKPFIPRSVDIADAVSSIAYAFEQGAFMVVMRVTNIQPHTLTHWLWERGLFHPPSIWDAVEVLRNLQPEYRKRVSIKGLDKDEIEPLAFSRGCESCSARLVSAFQHWNYDRNYDEFLAMVGDCNCRRISDFEHLEEFSKESVSDKIDQVFISLGLTVE